MAAMNPMERLRRALSFQETDRVPLDLGSGCTSIHRTAHAELKKLLGFSGGEEIIISSLMQIVDPDPRILKRFDIDVRHAAFKGAVPWRKIGDGLFADEWGIVYRDCGPYCEMVGHPLAEAAEPADLDRFPWPDPRDPRRFDGLEQEVLARGEEGKYPVMLGGFSESFFGLPSWLMGHENFFMNLALNEKLVNALLERLEDFFLKLAEEALRRVGHLVQIVKVSDDLGTQNGPITSPDLYRRLIKPRQGRLYKYIRENSDARLFLHSCGGIFPLIEDLLEIGVEILNPVQISARDMEPEKLKGAFGGRLVFWGGGCDTQHVLPRAAPAQVEREVTARLDTFAPGGGYVFSAVHNIQYDVPPENIVAMYDTARAYRL
jgi:uroporphyrinogen decarboxylase